MWPLSRRRFTEPEAEQQRGIQLESQSKGSQPVSNVLVIDALAAATPPNHSTVTVLGSRFLTRTRLRLSLWLLRKSRNQRLLYTPHLETYKGAHMSLDIILGGCAGQEICTHSRSFPRNGHLSSNRENAGFHYLKRRKISINGQNPWHELPRLQDPE